MTIKISFPSQIQNSFGKKEWAPSGGKYFHKINPHNGERICQVAASQAADLAYALPMARAAQKNWAAMPGVKRGQILFAIAAKLKERAIEMAEIISLETGKSIKDALGEVDAAILQAQFMAAEGQRLFGRTTTSGTPNRYPSVICEPIGITGLIIAANTPIANVAWKVFPALICGNAAILKAAEDTPITAWYFHKLAIEAGLPEDILIVLHGLGKEIGAAIVECNDIGLISFTGSTAVGKYIAEVAGKRLAKICLELGGKNPLVVCDDADLENAVKWALLSAFSNAGQRCASASRILIFDSIYEKFKNLFIKRVNELRVGVNDSDDFGPVINERQLKNMLAAVEKAKQAGAKVLTGGVRITDAGYTNGFYMPATVLENVDPAAEISTTELFGPITCLYRVKDFQEALQLANQSPYGLTASIHTKNFDRANEFVRRVEAGVAVVNGGTHGGEPHMPFGGVKQSGNGWREPGPEAISVYSNTKVIYQMVEPI